MSDQDFNFGPPPRREAKKAFEPPPWEQRQFDELARRKEAEKAVAEDEASTEEGHEGATAQAAPAGPSGEPLLQAESAAPVPTLRSENIEEDPRIEAMLLGLKNEEPRFGTQIWKFSLAAGAVLVLIGAVIVVWGGLAVAASSRTGPLGSLGGGILVAFGLGFLGVGGWIAVRTLRQQGVL